MYLFRRGGFATGRGELDHVSHALPYGSHVSADGREAWKGLTGLDKGHECLGCVFVKGEEGCGRIGCVGGDCGCF